MYRYILFALLCSLSNIYAQQTPADKQTKSILITGATVHLGNEEVILDGAVGLKDGKISYVGKVSQVNPIAFDTLIAADNKHIYPGFIALNTKIGLVEIDLVRATRDFREVGSITPNIRSLIAYNTDSKVTPTIRTNGVLLAQIVPLGGSISGTSSLVNLDAWNWEDAVVKNGDGVHLFWPSFLRRSGWWAEPGSVKKSKKYEEQTTRINTFLAEAYAYAQIKSVDEKNLKFEAMKAVFNKEANLYIHANSSREIMAAVTAAQQFDVKIVLVGGADSWMLTDFLKKNKVAVILTSTQRLPTREDTDIDQPFKTPALLHKAGIPFVLSHEGAWQQRNLCFQVGQAVAFGLSKEVAISSVTRNAARILGVDDQYGEIAEGKSATLFISRGDVLDMKTSIIDAAFIDGRQIDLDNKQKQLYQKFQDKYNK